MVELREWTMREQRASVTGITDKADDYSYTLDFPLSKIKKWKKK